MRKLLFLLPLIAGCSLFAEIKNTEPTSHKVQNSEASVEQPSQIDDFVIVDEHHEISLASLQNKTFNGTDLRLGSVLASNDAYTRYYITYISGELTISGIMNVPHGEGPFPLLILNHGFIEPSIYTNGRGLKREQDYLARQGYVVIHPDYRNHADSGTDDRDALAVRVSYVKDVINVIYAARGSELEFLDAERVGMLGHSMGGGIIYNVLTTQRELVDAAVLFAPVTANYLDSYRRWIERRPGVPDELDALYGSPEDNPEFWAGLNGELYFDNIAAPVMIHHGTVDADVPLSWSDDTVVLLESAGVDTTYHVYENEPHEFINSWPLVMQRTVDFFDQHLK